MKRKKEVKGLKHSIGIYFADNIIKDLEYSMYRSDDEEKILTKISIRNLKLNKITDENVITTGENKLYEQMAEELAKQIDAEIIKEMIEEIKTIKEKVSKRKGKLDKVSKLEDMEIGLDLTKLRSVEYVREKAIEYLNKFKEL